MAPGNPDKLTTILMNKVSDLEDRIKMLERFTNLDDESIQRAMEEKEEHVEHNILNLSK